MTEPAFNPFLRIQPRNPFLDLSSEIIIESQSTEVTKTSGKLRPDGSAYSKDPSTRMRQLHADGRAGPAFAHLGGARKKEDKRAGEMVAEAAREYAEQIKDVFIEGLDEDRPYSVRLKAAMELLAVEDREQAAALAREVHEFDALNKSQLVDTIIAQLADLQVAGQLAREVRASIDGDIVDADVID